MNKLAIEIVDIIRCYVIFRPRSKGELEVALNRWILNESKALKEYGNILLWDTELVEDKISLYNSVSLVDVLDLIKY